ncbi:MAG: response regulator [Clostridiales bacterium]|jgi:signal transduction histidine kinase/CheY-like chemotaxis protein|nr:response regulator [Clostridiales bacterium]
MKNKPGFLKKHRIIIFQLLFTAFAFTAMNAISRSFISEIIHDNLVRNANNVLDYTESQISSSALVYKEALNSFAEKAQTAVKRGNTVQELQQILNELHAYRFMGNNEMTGIQGFLGYFETTPGQPFLGYSGNLQLPSEFRIEEQGWYAEAVAANGEIIETVPITYANVGTFFRYAKCLLDENGKRLGVVCIYVNIEDLGTGIVSTALNHGGYGMLIGQDGTMLFHPNEEFRGINIENTAIPISKFAQQLKSQGDVTEGKTLSYLGEDSVVFVHTIENGWHVGLVTPEHLFYGSMNRMSSITTLLSVFFAMFLGSMLVWLYILRTRSDEESKLKSAFLANMSHEIRTPINAIVGMTAVGKSSASPERKDYCFSRIGEVSGHLLGLINDILDMSKIEANKIEISPADFNFENMLQQVVNVVNLRADEKHQKLSVFIDKNIPDSLFADEQRLAQVITNLMGNAVKFAPENGEVELRAQLLDEGNGVYTIRVDVSDNGIGISADQQAKLFQTFQQAEATTTRKYGGTGLGLAISKSIVELMGGKIWVESSPGKGSVFSFTVTAKLGDDMLGTKLNGGWNMLRILVADGDKGFLDYFRDIVQRFGANCFVAANTDEANEIIDEMGAFDIYFVDLHVPGIGGSKLTKQIAAKYAKAGTFTILMTASADINIAEKEASNAGADRFLQKPVFPSDIMNVINNCLGVRKEIEQEQIQNIEGVLEGKYILVAEDVDINYEIVEALLEPTLANVSRAANGQEAVDMFSSQSEKYDLIYMDVQMPVMDGYDATRQIRALNTPKARRVPIVAMTANVFKDDIAKCIESGMDDHIGKPLDVDVFLGKTVSYIRKTSNFP